ncbi:hypothetical protein AB4212_71475, partial [Streptomyces sp. 2MCAF27]
MLDSASPTQMGPGQRLQYDMFYFSKMEVVSGDLGFRRNVPTAEVDQQLTGRTAVWCQKLRGDPRRHFRCLPSARGKQLLTH